MHTSYLRSFPQVSQKLSSSSSHIHLSNLLLLHHCTWNSTRNAHVLRFTITDFIPPTNPVMLGHWRRSYYTYFSTRLSRQPLTKLTTISIWLLCKTLFRLLSNEIVKKDTSELRCFWKKNQSINDSIRVLIFLHLESQNNFTIGEHLCK